MYLRVVGGPYVPQGVWHAQYTSGCVACPVYLRVWCTYGGVPQGVVYPTVVYLRV